MHLKSASHESKRENRNEVLVLSIQNHEGLSILTYTQPLGST